MSDGPGTAKQLRGVFVAGMHSGGTSAITCALIGLGLGGPVDSPEPSQQHPHGISESPRMWEFNERLLEQLGTSLHVGMHGVPPERVVNCWETERLLEWLRSRQM